MIQKGSIIARVMIGLAAIAVVAGACSAAPAASGGATSYTIGFTNPGGVGNGWREAMLCSAKAQAVKAGNVSKVTIIHRDTDAPGQLSDIRTLIAQGVNAIIINPAGPDALNPAIKEAIDAGITVIAVDASVTAPGAYNLSNDQEQYAYLGASWLFKEMGGTGAVVYMRGIAGHPADTDRDTGFQRALKENPGISIANTAVTKWDPAIGDQPRSTTSSAPARSSTASGRRASTPTSLTRSRPPTIRTCRSSARTMQASSPSCWQPTARQGAAVTNPASIGGAGVTLALQILGGEKPAETTVHVTPELWANTDEAGKASPDGGGRPIASQDLATRPARSRTGPPTPSPN